MAHARSSGVTAAPGSALSYTHSSGIDFTHPVVVVPEFGEGLNVIALGTGFTVPAGTHDFWIGAGGSDDQQEAVRIPMPACQLVEVNFEMMPAPGISNSVRIVVYKGGVDSGESFLIDSETGIGGLSCALDFARFEPLAFLIVRNGPNVPAAWIKGSLKLL